MWIKINCLPFGSANAEVDPFGLDDRIIDKSIISARKSDLNFIYLQEKLIKIELAYNLQLQRFYYFLVKIS